MQYLVTNHSESADNLAVNQKIGELYAYCGQYGNRSSYNVGFVQKRETLETGNFLDYRDFYLIFDRVPAKVRYYDAQNGAGFDYAYRYPGMNKVLQAAGRVIRTPEDRGAVLLLDDRFYEEYMVDALTSQEMEQYITRIAVKILR